MPRCPFCKNDTTFLAVRNHVFKSNNPNEVIPTLTIIICSKCEQAIGVVDEALRGVIESFDNKLSGILNKE